MKATQSLLWLALLVAAPALADQDVSKISGDVQTQAGQKYGDLSTVSGDIHVATGVEADGVQSVSGDVTVDANAKLDSVTSVSGDVTVADNGHLHEASTVSGNLSLGRNAVVDKDLTSVSGSVFVDRGGKIGGDVTSVSGSLGLVGTEVGGDITFVSSDVTVGVGSHVKGHVRLKKPTHGNVHVSRPPRVVIGPGAVVDGPLDFELPVTLYVHSTAKVGAISGATPIAFSTPTPPKS